MSTFNLLSLGTQALKTNQNALGVVGQNISNASTEGYSRQVVHFSSLQPAGVEIETVERVTNEFLNRQFWTDTSSFQRADVYSNLAVEADALLGQDLTNITTAVDSYFGAMQNAVDDPTAMAHRELLLTSSATLSRRMNDLYDNINIQYSKINERIEDSVSKVNTLAVSVADYNNQIRQANARGDSVNELLDKRDQALEEMAKNMDIQVIENAEGLVDVRVAGGQPLVVGLDANSLYTYSAEPNGLETRIGIEISGTRSEITDNISGGTIGGVIAYRKDILSPTLNELGRISIAFSLSMNDMQARGMDLNNDLGEPLFEDPNSNYNMNQRVTGHVDNKGSFTTAQAEITDLSKLNSDEYELEFTGHDSFKITNRTTGEVTEMSELRSVVSNGDVSNGTYHLNATSGELRLEIDGFRLNIQANGNFRYGDKLSIQPTRHGAQQMDAVLTDPRKLALASPVRANTDTENTGTGELSVKVTDIQHETFQLKERALTPPVEIVFSGTEPNLTFTAYDITDPANPQVLDVGNGPLKDQPYKAGVAIDLGGYEATIINDPRAGDTFSFEYNTDGFSDNRNALDMSNLQQADLLDTGSYQDSYSGLLERVAGKAAGAKMVTASSQAVYESTVNARASVSGVNMDEEAARLVQFQQAYQASARMISTAQTMFDTILNL